MSDKKLTILGIVAVIVVLLAALQSHVANKITITPSDESFLIQGLDTDKVASIILGTTDSQVIFNRDSNHFTVANKDDYPADNLQIGILIAQCLDIKTAELITDNPANHADLGVIEADGPYVVKFLDKDSQLITGLVISKPGPDASGTYARLVSSNDVYLLQNPPMIRTSALDYIDKKLFNIEKDNIDSVKVTLPDDEYTLMTQLDSDDIILENMPADKKLKESDYEQVFSALTNLDFNDVKKDTSGIADIKFDKTYTCSLKDSTVYTINISQDDDKTYVKCSAEFTDKTEVTKDRNVESEEELKKKEAILLARDNAETFSEKNSGWIYEIAEYQAENLTKKLSDLLEDKEQQDADAASKTEDAKDNTGQQIEELDAIMGM